MNALESVVRDLFNEVDIPPPSADWPIAPLKPILSRLPIRCIELPALNCEAAQQYLLTCGALSQPLTLGDAEQQQEALAGFAYQGGECAFLFVSADDPVVRRRFSMAHELGHYVLHFRPMLTRWREALEAGEDITVPLFDAFSQKDVESAEKPLIDNFVQREREADLFAAALLMPASIVGIRAHALSEEFERDQAGLEDRLAMEFLVSRAAMRRRLAGLGDREP